MRGGSAKSTRSVRETETHECAQVGATFVANDAAYRAWLPRLKNKYELMVPLLLADGPLHVLLRRKPHCFGRLASSAR